LQNYCQTLFDKVLKNWYHVLMKNLQYPILLNLGLNETEAKVYETLLQNGPLSGAKIAETSGIGRGNVYNALQTLKTQHLVTEYEGKIATFEAAPPSVLEKLLNKQKSQVEQIGASFKNILPLLTQAYTTTTNKPIVRIFEGEEGIKQIYLEMLAEGKSIYSIMNPKQPPPGLFKWLRQYYTKNRIQKNISVTAVLNETERTKELIQNSEKELRNYKLVNQQNYSFAGEINVFGSKLAFISYETDKLIGLLIESRDIALTIGSTIKLMHDILPNQGFTSSNKT